MNRAKFTGIVLIFEALLIFVPMYILGSAVGWPGNLSEPASFNLPLMLAKKNEVAIGYSIYLLYSLLFFVVAYLIHRVIFTENSRDPIGWLGLGFAIMSTVSRVLGIARWLFAMPVLAKAYAVDSPATRENISILYEVLNSYLGGLGEILGVGLFSAIWISLVSYRIYQSQSFPRWLAYFGWTAALFLCVPIIEFFTVDLGAVITLSVAVFHFWLIALGVFFIKNPPDSSLRNA